MVNGTYDCRLVALSLVIAVLTSYAALDLAGRVTANRGSARAAWLAGGALAMGGGIWCMHFTGMLAFRLPLTVFYHVPTVLLSLLAAVLASFIALFVVSRERMSALHVVVGSVLMGTAIATMHYVGMAAMRLQAMHIYNPALWILSVVLAVVISMVGLLLIFYSREGNQSAIRKVSVALVLGIAIPAMHYTGMAAVKFVPTSVPPSLRHSLDISTLANAAVLSVTFVILGFALLTSIVDRRLSAQQLILESERQMLRALIDNIPDFIYVKDMASRFVIANPTVALALGAQQPRDLIGKTDFDFLPAERAQPFFDDEQRMMRTGESVFSQEEKLTDAQGVEYPILTTKVPLRDSKGRLSGLAGVARDIRERKKSEDALREAERRYRGIFDDAMVGIFQIAADGQLMAANPALARIFGYASPEAMLSGASNAWQTYVDPARQQEFVALMAAQGHVQNFEAQVVRSDGNQIWLSSSARAFTHHGALVRYEGMSEDVTEIKLLRDQLYQAQKLESVGQLAAGIAHEINTPVQYIGDNVRFLKDSFGDLSHLLGLYGELVAGAQTEPPTLAAIASVAEAAERSDIGFLLQEIPNAFEQTLEGIGRVSTLVSAMKEFSHPGTKDKIPLDLNHAIQSTITIAKNEWKYVADMETSFDPTVPLVCCLPGEFNQVILNLIINAAHAIQDVVETGAVERGKITVTTKEFPGSVEIRIIDTGAGIPGHVRSRIFDPFFTTKEIGKGTGQGLAIARSVIVDKHGGSINFETAIGKGTTFIIRLPHNSGEGPEDSAFQLEAESSLETHSVR